MKQHKKYNNNELSTFLKTFIIAFVIVLMISTPAAAMVGRALDSPIMGESPDMPVLEEEMDVLIPEDSPFFDAFTEAKKVNILVLGINSGLTDVIILACLDTENTKVDLIWIPRDTYYQREGYNSDAERKINAAYRKDPVNTAEAVSDILMGIPINYYVIADYEGIETIVDAMGGVPMNIPAPMKYNDPYDKPPLHINIPAGEQVLNGEDAVKFLRYRRGYAEGDIGRVKAQQQFMINAFKQCISFDLPKITKTICENLTSDIKLKTALYLAGKGVGVTAGDITTYMIPHDADPDPPYYIYPKAEEIAAMLTEIYSVESADDEAVGEDGAALDDAGEAQDGELQGADGGEDAGTE